MILTLLGLRRKAEPVAAKPRRRRVQAAFGPPLTEEEQQANLSELEKSLNAQMKCPAGRNHVFIRSLVTGNGTTQPRIALRCPYRKDIGLPAEVFYEHIRDVCCKDPNQCEAYRAFKHRRVPT